jgi:hypothetical protein
LKDKKRGNSDYNDRIKLVNEYIDTFGLARIKYILGDREFIGKDWISWLDEKQIPYIIRIKENGQYIANKRGKMVKAASLFKYLEIGRSAYLGKRNIGKIDTYSGHLTGLKTVHGQVVILIHSAHIEQPCQAYRYRWQIGVSRLRTLHLVGGSPTEVKDSNLVAWEASWHASKTMEPFDKVSRKGYEQYTRP